MLAEQQKQTLDYANRLDANDKKSEEMSRKISTLLQELNKCRIELNYWRSKSPATPICNNCGHTAISMPSTEDLLALMNQSMCSSDDSLNVTVRSYTDLDGDVSATSHDLSGEVINVGAGDIVTGRQIDNSNSGTSDSVAQTSKTLAVHTLKQTSIIPATITSVQNSQQQQQQQQHQQQQQTMAAELAASNDSTIAGVILTVGTPKMHGKRKLAEINQLQQAPHDDNSDCTAGANAVATIAPIHDVQSMNNCNISDNYNKKARRVQNKVKCSNLNIKTRNK